MEETKGACKMLYKCGNIISDGKRGITVPSGFCDWHSEMEISEISGIPCDPIPYPKHKDSASAVTAIGYYGSPPKLKKPPLKPYRRPKRILQ